MSTFRLATFNAENLFARYRFRKNFEPLESDGFTINNLAFDIYNEAEKRITALAIAAIDADILVLQEVENLLVLDRFVAQYLRAAQGVGGKRYVHRMLIDGNDPRNIDVAVLSVFPITSARTYRHVRSPDSTAELFSRDCLEVEFAVEGRPFVVYANHFKSMMEGRAATKPRRLVQAAEVRRLVEARFGADLDGNFAIVGDLNDYPQTAMERGVEVTTSLSALLDHPGIVDPVDRLPETERWTHWYKGGRKGERARQLDYVLLSAALDARAAAPIPGLERRGLPWRAEEDYAGERFPEIGQDEPKASDHCPLYVDIPVAALSRDGGGAIDRASLDFVAPVKPKKPKKPKKPV